MITMCGSSMDGGGKYCSLGGSGVGHICIVTTQSGWTAVSHSCGRMTSSSGPTRS